MSHVRLRPENENKKGFYDDSVRSHCLSFLTRNLVVVSVHLARRDEVAARVQVGANTSLKAAADRQVVGVLIILDRVILTFQGAQVKLKTTPGVTNSTLITWEGMMIQSS